jgi:predicted RNase H-like HicB family nuclease
MPHYIALIHKDPDSCFGVTFPDWPGVTTAGDTVEEALQNASEVLEVAAEDWESRDGRKGPPSPRSFDELRHDPDFRDDSAEAVVALVPFRTKAVAAE